MSIAIKFILLLLVLPIVISCNHQDDTHSTSKKIASIQSQDGCCVAEIIESEGVGNSSNTQVIIYITSTSCGSGAVSAVGVNLGLSIRWKDSATLVVSHPEGLELTRNASGEWLQCGSYNTHVILEPRSA
jgi:hypothetical protein